VGAPVLRGTGARRADLPALPRASGGRNPQVGGLSPLLLPQAGARPETELLVQAALVSSLGDLLEAGTALPQFLTSYLRAETPPLLRSVAALAFARHAGPAAPPAVLQVLLEAIAHRELVEASFGQLPQVYAAHYDDFPTHVCQTLAKTGPEHAIPALAEVLRGYSSAGGDMKELRLIEEVQLWRECRGVAESLLAAAFTEGELPGGVRQPEPVALPLRQLQRMALTVLVEEEALWRPYAQLGYSQEYQLFELFEDFGLPAAREDLRALLHARP